MTQSFLLESESFRLSMDFQVFESDIVYPSNTTLTVSVFSESFSAASSLDIDAKNIPAFYIGMKIIYDSLEGEAVIAEAYGKQNVTFTCDRYGHIFISGLLCSGGMNGFFQELKFENALDQTFLPPFLKELESFSEMLVRNI